MESLGGEEAKQYNRWGCWVSRSYLVEIFDFYNVKKMVVTIVVAEVVENLSTTGMAAHVWGFLGGKYLPLSPVL